MMRLKVTEEYRVETEQEVKTVSDQFRQEAKEKGYTISSIAYTQKTKKAKGEIVDEGYLLKVTKVYGGFWDGL